jgi:hypothetical protein
MPALYPTFRRPRLSCGFRYRGVYNPDTPGATFHGYSVELPGRAYIHVRWYPEDGAFEATFANPIGSGKRPKTRDVKSLQEAFDWGTVKYRAWYKRTVR